MFALLQDDQPPPSHTPALPSAPAVLDPALAQLLDGLDALWTGVNLKDLVLAQMQQAASASSSAAAALASNVHVPPPSAAAAEVPPPAPVAEPEIEHPDAQGFVDDTYADKLFGDFTDESPKPAKRSRIAAEASPDEATLPGDPFGLAESQDASVFNIQATHQAQTEVETHALLQHGAVAEADRVSPPDPPLIKQTTSNATLESTSTQPPPAAASAPKPRPAPSRAPSAKPPALPQPQPNLATLSAHSTPLGLQAPHDAQQQLQLKIETLQAALAAALAFQRQPVPPTTSAALLAPQSTPGHTIAPTTTAVLPPLTQHVSPPVAAPVAALAAQGLPATAVVAKQPALHMPSLKSLAHRGPPPPALVAIPTAPVRPPALAQQTFPQAASLSSQSHTATVSEASAAVQPREDVLNLGSKQLFSYLECLHKAMVLNIFIHSGCKLEFRESTGTKPSPCVLLLHI